MLPQMPPIAQDLDFLVWLLQRSSIDVDLEFWLQKTNFSFKFGKSMNEAPTHHQKLSESQALQQYP